MFIYGPGAGCSGESQLVKPGDELKFTGSTTQSFNSDGHEVVIMQQICHEHEKKVISMTLRFIYC